MTRRTPFHALALLVLAACGTDSLTSTGPRLSAAPSLAKGGGSGGGANTLYAYTFSGDAVSPAGPAGTTSQSTTAPFRNLTVSGVTVTLSAPTGNISACRLGTATYVDHFGENAGRTFTGTLTVPKTGGLSFLGTEVGGSAQVQFSAGDATGGPVETAGAGGTYTHTLTDARLFFGGNSTYFDGLYRCVNLTVTATPSP